MTFDIDTLNSVRTFVVGGAVRDEIMGVKSKDIDIAVEAPSYAVMREWIRIRGEIFQEKPEYLTIRARMSGFGAVDFVLCRKDGAYQDGRRPDVVEPGTLYDDLRRRDFTMNAIARATVGEKDYIDPFFGIQDIRQGVIRCVGLAYDRFNEDSLRIIRAIRFSITKGFSLDTQIIEAMRNKDLCERLSSVSDDRKREELNKCFSANTLFTLRILNDFPFIQDALFSSGSLRLQVVQTKG